MRAWNRILLRWSWPRIKREVREIKSEWESERVNALNQMELIAVQESSIYSLYRVLGVTLYFSKGFLKVVSEAPQSLGVTMVCFLE